MDYQVHCRVPHTCISLRNSYMDHCSRFQDLFLIDFIPQNLSYLMHLVKCLGGTSRVDSTMKSANQACFCYESYLIVAMIQDS